MNTLLDLCFTGDSRLIVVDVQTLRFSTIMCDIDWICNRFNKLKRLKGLFIRHTTTRLITTNCRAAAGLAQNISDHREHAKAEIS